MWQYIVVYAVVGSWWAWLLVTNRRAGRHREESCPSSCASHTTYDLIRVVGQVNRGNVTQIAGYGEDGAGVTASVFPDLDLTKRLRC